MKFLALALSFPLLAVVAATDTDPGKSMGSPGAPIRIEVFSDFECPACKGLHEQVLPLLMSDYVISGKVYLVNREFPLPMHKYSREAAGYAVAAARVGKYQQVSDALFKSQAIWAENGKVWDTVSPVLSATEAKKVQALAKDPGVLSEIEREAGLAKTEVINQTPTMIVTRGSNRYPLAGAVNYNLLRSLLDGLLKK
jgi:protein-disulfide isomerase